MHCPKCKAVFDNQSSVERHVNGTKCRTQVAAARAKHLGMVRVTNDMDARALIEANIESIKVPVRFAMWAPSWAVEAARSFRKSFRRRYAGMTLVELLRKMAPKDTNNGVSEDTNVLQEQNNPGQQ